METALSKLDEERIGALVVVDRWGKLAGMFSERDVIHALAARHHAGAAVTARGERPGMNFGLRVPKQTGRLLTGSCGT